MVAVVLLSFGFVIVFVMVVLIAAVRSYHVYTHCYDFVRSWLIVVVACCCWLFLLLLVVICWLLVVMIIFVDVCWLLVVLGCCLLLVVVCWWLVVGCSFLLRFDCRWRVKKKKQRRRW